MTVGNLLVKLKQFIVWLWNIGKPELELFSGMGAVSDKDIRVAGYRTVFHIRENFVGLLEVPRKGPGYCIVIHKEACHLGRLYSYSVYTSCPTPHWNTFSVGQNAYYITPFKRQTAASLRLTAFTAIRSVGKMLEMSDPVTEIRNSIILNTLAELGGNDVRPANQVS